MMVDMMQNLRTPMTSLNMATSLLVEYRAEKVLPLARSVTH